MADVPTRFDVLDDQGVTTMSKEIFTLIKRDFATKTAVSTIDGVVNEMKNLFNINPTIVNGNLIISYPDDETPPDIAIDSSGNLMIDPASSPTAANIAKLSFAIEDDGNLYVENSMI